MAAAVAMAAEAGMSRRRQVAFRGGGFQGHAAPGVQSTPSFSTPRAMPHHAAPAGNFNRASAFNNVNRATRSTT